MRSKIFGSICVLLFISSACGSDDAPGTNENLAVEGIWAIQNGQEFSYLIFLPDNTFLYAENDLNSGVGENGVEVGSYSVNSSQGEITFNIEYDDNDPGNDSGIGDIGSPVTFSAALVNGPARLSLLDGELVFNKSELIETSPIIGVWSYENGAEFSYLALLSDNTFLYAENDLAVTSSTENGLEVGTFVDSPSTEELIFDILYDDNDPGNDSGVGDIGSSITLDAVLSNENNTLTIAGLELSRAL